MSESAPADQIVLVTGASRGLGFAVARSLCRSGATVFALARTLGGLEDLDDIATKEGGRRPTLLPLDLNDDGAVERLGAAIYERHGRLDLLIHCAIHAPPLSPVNHIATKDLDRAWAVNARAVQQLLRSLDPLFRVAERPRAVFFPDPRDDAPYWSAYAATKEAGLSFARIYAAETANRGFEAVFHQPPAMPTATRGRFFPGQDNAALTPCDTAAEALIAELAQPSPV